MQLEDYFEFLVSKSTHPVVRQQATTWVGVSGNDRTR